jgi:Ca2+-binding RTX toxin-like protein
MGTASIDNSGYLGGNASGYNATFTNESSADWSINGSSVFTGTSTLINAGLIESNGTSSITGLSGTTSTGTIEVETGSLTIAGPAAGAGTVVIFSGATMEFGATSDAHVQFDTGGPSAPGTLALDDVAHFTGSVTGFSLNDTIHLVGINPANVNVSSSGGLHVNYGAGSFALAGAYDPAGFSVVTDNAGGTDIIWHHDEPFILTNNFTVTNNGGTTTVSGLQIVDSDPGTSVSITASTAGAASGSSVSPTSASGALSSINSTLGTGIIYSPGLTPPVQDKVILTAVDSFGASETVNFIFNNNSSINLQGTPGNDVLFASGQSDTLTGGGGADQFVFKPTGGSSAVQHTITDFNAAIDTLDLRQFQNISTSSLPTELQAGNDTLITLDSQDTLLLKNVAASSLHTSDFIVHA